MIQFIIQNYFWWNCSAMYSLIKSLKARERTELKVIFYEKVNEIHVHVMGEVQIEILKKSNKESLIHKYQRFWKWNIVYKKLILDLTGNGHYGHTNIVGLSFSEPTKRDEVLQLKIYYVITSRIDS